MCACNSYFLVLTNHNNIRYMRVCDLWFLHRFYVVDFARLFLRETAGQLNKFWKKAKILEYLLKGINLHNLRIL